MSSMKELKWGHDWIVVETEVAGSLALVRFSA